jgi:hypothetical protein
MCKLNYGENMILGFVEEDGARKTTVLLIYDFN